MMQTDVLPRSTQNVGCPAIFVPPDRAAARVNQRDRVATKRGRIPLTVMPWLGHEHHPLDRPRRAKRSGVHESGELRKVLFEPIVKLPLRLELLRLSQLGDDLLHAGSLRAHIWPPFGSQSTRTPHNRMDGQSNSQPNESNEPRVDQYRRIRPARSIHQPWPEAFQQRSDALRLTQPNPSRYDQ
jgi:hypothetical protein